MIKDKWLDKYAAWANDILDQEVALWTDDKKDEGLRVISSGETNCHMGEKFY